MKISIKIVLLLVLSAVCMSKRIGLSTFNVIYSNQSGEEEEVSLSFDDIYIEYDSKTGGDSFKFVRPHHSKGEDKESQDIKVVLSQYFDNVESDAKSLSIRFESEQTTTDYARRGEFGDAYVIIDKSSKGVEGRFNVLTKKGDKNADDFFNTMAKYSPKENRFLN